MTLTEDSAMAAAVKAAAPGPDRARRQAVIIPRPDLFALRQFEGEVCDSTIVGARHGDEEIMESMIDPKLSNRPRRQA
jgi:hypothetical protein